MVNKSLLTEPYCDSLPVWLSRVSAMVEPLTPSVTSGSIN